MKNQNTTLYNVIFPIRLLFALPQFWIVALPANWIIDFLVIFFTAKYLKIPPGSFAFKSVWLTWIAGFFSDAIGGVIMLYDDFAGPSNKTEFGKWFSSTVGQAIYNPFDNVFAFLRTLLAVSPAVFTAPYLFFVPTNF